MLRLSLGATLVVLSLGSHRAWTADVLAAEASLPSEEAAQGFERLFDGPTFPKQDWVCWFYDGSEACEIDPIWSMFPDADAFGKDQKTHSIYSKKTYRDFEARFDFDWRRTKDGVFFYRITDFSHEHPGRHLGYYLPYHNGSIYNPGDQWDLYHGQPDTVKHPPNGDWSSARVVALGDSIEHWLNGEKVVAYRIGSPDFRKRLSGYYDGGAPSFDSTLGFDGRYPLLQAGPIGWLGSWGGGIRIRNFRIANLPLQTAALHPGKGSGDHGVTAPVSRILRLTPGPSPGRAAGHRFESTGSERDFQGRSTGQSREIPVSKSGAITR